MQPRSALGLGASERRSATRHRLESQTHALAEAERAQAQRIRYRDIVGLQTVLQDNSGGIVWEAAHVLLHYFLDAGLQPLEGVRELLDARLVGGGELDAQQVRTFTRWWNSWLSEVDLQVSDLCEDVKPGVLPIKLLEVLLAGFLNRTVKIKGRKSASSLLLTKTVRSHAKAMRWASSW